MLFSVVLKDNKAFNRCFRSGRFCSCRYVTAYYMPNKMPYNRVGLSVSKKVGNAVERNRAKRIMRAAYRLSETDFPIGFDLVLVARPDIDGLKTQHISEFFEKRLLSDMKSSIADDGSFIKPKKNKKK